LGEDAEGIAGERVATSERVLVSFIEREEAAEGEDDERPTEGED
jgi:hypothetical protein